MQKPSRFVSVSMPNIDGATARSTHSSQHAPGLRCHRHKSSVPEPFQRLWWSPRSYARRRRPRLAQPKISSSSALVGLCACLPVFLACWSCFMSHSRCCYSDEAASLTRTHDFLLPLQKGRYHHRHVGWHPRQLASQHVGTYTFVPFPSDQYQLMRRLSLSLSLSLSLVHLRCRVFHRDCWVSNTNSGVIFLQRSMLRFVPQAATHARTRGES